MKAQVKIFCLAVVLVIPLVRGEDPTAQPILIDASAEKSAFDAAIGKLVVVQGTVLSASWSETGRVMNIEFRNAARSRFIAVIFERNRAKIDEGFNGNVAGTLAGAKVRIRGMLETYGGQIESWKDRPQLVITVGDQITILETAPATQPSKQ
jgi:hypothetical protein